MMLFVYRLFVLFLLYLPIVWFGQGLSLTCGIHVDFYGIFLLSAICGLRKIEALLSLFFLGLYLDTPILDIKLWGWSGFLLVSAVILFHSDTWRNIFTARPRLWACLLNLVLQSLFLCGAFFVYNIPFSTASNYLSSVIFSTLCVGFFIRPFLRWQEHYLV